MKYGITRSILSVLVRFAQPVQMLTKAASVTRDISLWRDLAKVSDSQVAFSVPTLDADVWKKLEPGTAMPIKRLQAMRELVDAGVRCGVMIAPIVPGLTDDESQLEEVIRAASDHGASFVSPNVLHLRPGTKEWFMPALRAAYPHLTPKYERWYRGSYAPKEYTEQVLAKVSELRDKWGMTRTHDAPRPTRGQMKMTI